MLNEISSDVTDNYCLSKKDASFDLNRDLAK